MIFIEKINNAIKVYSDDSYFDEPRYMSKNSLPYYDENDILIEQVGNSPRSVKFDYDLLNDKFGTTTPQEFVEYLITNDFFFEVGNSDGGDDTFIPSISFSLNSLDNDYHRSFSSGYEPACDLPIKTNNTFNIEKCFVNVRSSSGGEQGGVFFNVRDNEGFITYFEFSGSVTGLDPSKLELTPVVPLPQNQDLSLRLYAASTGGTVYISSVQFTIVKNN